MGSKIRNLAPWKNIATLAIGVVIGASTLGTPVDGHVTRSVGHVRKHLAPNFGRAAYDALEPFTTSNANGFIAEWTHTITPGKASGVVKVDASVAVSTPGFVCVVSVAAFVNNVQVTSLPQVSLGAGVTEVFSLTGLGTVTSSAPNSVKIRVQDLFPCGNVVISGDATSAYIPLNATGS